MPAPPLPPPGYRWRPARLSDADALADLFRAVDEAEGIDEVLGPEGIRRELAHPGLDLAHDTLLGLSPGATAAAFAWVWTQQVGQCARAIVWIEAHPDHLHLEPFLLDWAEACARPRLGADDAARRYLRHHVEEHRRRRRRAVEEAGYRHARTFLEMWRPLDRESLAAVPAPPGTEIVPWSPPLAEGARLVANEAFASHWDSLPLDREDWQQRVCEDPYLRPDLSRLAVRHGEVLAFCLVSVDPEHNAREGAAEIWVERVGTVPARQRQGLATALLGAVLHAGATAGFTRAGLGVDLAGTSGAAALYERLGFVATRRTLAYVKELE